MKSTEFCYWLQGSIELNESTSFNVKQTQLIKKHLEMVIYHEGTPQLPFINWLSALFDIDNPASISKEKTQIIKEKLGNTFLNYIDPNYPSHQQQKLNDIHNPTEVASPRFEKMC